MRTPSMNQAHIEHLIIPSAACVVRRSGCPGLQASERKWLVVTVRRKAIWPTPLKSRR